MTDIGPNADERFVDYYAEQSASEQTRQRIESVRRILLNLRIELGLPTTSLDVVDVGCGAGAQALAWARDGHRAQGIDISAPLIELARKRAAEACLPAEFHVGSATKLPLRGPQLRCCPGFGTAGAPPRLGGVRQRIAARPAARRSRLLLNDQSPLPDPAGVHATALQLVPGVSEEDTARGSPSRRTDIGSSTRAFRPCTGSPSTSFATTWTPGASVQETGSTSWRRRDPRLRSAVVGAARRFATLRFLGHVLTPYTVVAGFKRPAET